MTGLTGLTGLTELTQELFKVESPSFAKPFKRFKDRAISQILAMNRKANEKKDNWRHLPICQFEQFLLIDRIDG